MYWTWLFSVYFSIPIWIGNDCSDAWRIASVSDIPYDAWYVQPLDQFECPSSNQYACQPKIVRCSGSAASTAAPYVRMVGRFRPDVFEITSTGPSYPHARSCWIRLMALSR